MTVEQPLPTPNLVAGNVIRVGAQTGFDVDDVAVQTDAGNFALFQAKAAMSLGKSETSDLAKALEQCVEQYLRGRLPVDDGTERKVDPLRDALVLCTDSAAPATVKVHLKKAVERTASQPCGTSLGHELTTKEDDALKILLDHVRRLWKKVAHPQPTDEEIRAFMRALRVMTIDAKEGESHHAAAVATISTVLETDSDAATAWKVLVDEGQAASETRQWRDRAAIGNALLRQGLVLSPPHRYASDIAKLREVSTANLHALASEAILPVPGGLRISRGVSAKLAEQAGETNILIVGDAGAGKSAVAQKFASERSEVQDVVVLHASDIAGANKVPLGAKLPTILQAWTGPASLLLIDGVDALRGADDRRFLSATVLALHDSRWQVVATARTFDARNNQELRNAFAGSPLSDDPVQVDSRLHSVRHLLVGDLTDTELDSVMSTPLMPLLAQAAPELRALLRSPFNLRLSAQLVEHLSGSQHTQLLAVRSRAGLLNAYWEWRIRNEDRTAREALLTRLCEAMAASRHLTVVESEPVVTAADSTAVTAMLSENVLRSDGGVLPGARGVLSFSHNILFDYAVALYLLLDPIEPTKLLNTLDADPSLPLVARLSFEMLVDLLWENRDADVFWPLSLALAKSDHVLASLAFASRLLCLIHEADDLAPLAPPLSRTDRSDGMSPDQELVRQLVGALHTPAVLPDPIRAVVPLATLARHLAENSAASPIDAALSADLLQGLQIRNPIIPGKPGTDDRAQAIAALLDGCRTDPERMEQLAGAAARQLKYVVGISESARNAVHRLLTDENALSQWGGTVLTGLAEAIVLVAGHNPSLARHIATTILTYDEDRQGQVSLIRSALLPLNEARRQQAEHSIYVLGKRFGELCTSNLLVATEIFCDLAEDTHATPTIEKWPVSVANSEGWLQERSDQLRNTHDVGQTAARALSTALANADTSDAEAVIAVVVKRLHNTEAWAALLTSDDNAVNLGRVLLPALQSGALLAHPDTHHAAATLLGAVAMSEPTLTSQLEQAVLNAYALADLNHVHSRVKDALIGCLDAGAITSALLKARLEELGPDGLPEILSPYPTITAATRAWSPFDEMPAQGIQLRREVESAGRDLDAEVQRVNNGVDARPEAERLLPELFATADAVFTAYQELPPILERLMADAASALARDPRVKPGTSLGDRVLTVLISAKNSSDTGRMFASDGWSPGIRDTAVGGLTSLLVRPEWRDDEAGKAISDAVSAALRDPNPLVRMIAAHAAAALHSDVSTEDAAAAVGDLILTEESPAVRTVLIHQLAQVSVGAEETVDLVLDLLLDDNSVDPTTGMGRAVIELLTYLAISPRTPLASRTIEHWCNDAPANAGEVHIFVQCARDYLGLNGGSGRAEAYRLLTAAARSSHARWTRNPEEHRTAELSGQQRAELQGAVDVAEEIGQQIYFTSGGAYAYQEGEGHPPGPEHAAFAELAYPLLAICARLQVPKCIHPAVQTMIFLAPLNEPRALQAVVDAVPAHGLYAGESIAGDDVIPYLERLLAEERQLVLHDAAGVNAFRQLLATFASAGNSDALALAYTFADVFR
ncbi:hypothetical protein BK799_29590 [Rhodococcus sp. D-1]|nr:hypothetical protein BK799_29590 [Rhodococcus sp. D-1]